MRSCRASHPQPCKPQHLPFPEVNSLNRAKPCQRASPVLRFQGSQKHHCTAYSPRTKRRDLSCFQAIKLPAFQWQKEEDKLSACKTRSDLGFTQHAVSIWLSAHGTKISNSALETEFCPEVCVHGSGRDPNGLTTKPPSQTGFPKEVLGHRASLCLCWLCHLVSSGAPPLKSRGRGGGGPGEVSFLLFLMPLTPLSPLVIAGNRWTSRGHWMTSQVFSLAYLLHGDSSPGLRLWLPELQLYLP